MDKLSKTIEKFRNKPVNIDLENEPDIINAAAKFFSQRKRMFAIAFDMDTDLMMAEYISLNPNNNPDSYKNWYQGCIRTVLVSHGFTWKQGSVYFGDDTVNEVKTVVAVQDLQRQYPWFIKCVRDIRMLRIEAQSDLKPALNFIKNS